MRSLGAAHLALAISFLSDPQSAVETSQASSRANALIEAGRPEEAIPIYKGLASAFPNEASFGINLAIALFKAGHYRAAAEECKTLVNRQPDLFPAWLFLGASYSKLGEVASAEMPLRKALAMRPADPNALIMLADLLLVQERWAAAAESYAASAQKMPDSPRVWYGLLRSYDSLARSSLTRLEAEAPHSPQTSALSAEFELGAVQLAAAFHHFREVLTVEPSFPGIHAKVAVIYQTIGHEDWAAVERLKEHREGACISNSLECDYVAGRLSKIASAKPDSPEDIYWQAIAFLDLSRQAHARLEALPASQEGYEAAALLDEERGRYPEAAAAWNNALQFAPSDARLQRRLALALCHGNDCGSAIPLLKEQLVREPSSVELNYLCGLAISSVRNPAQAIPYLQNAVRLDSTFLPARAVLGEAYLEAGNPAQAISNLKAALAIDQSGERHYQLARAYAAAGMPEQSVEALREYRDVVRKHTAGQLTEASISPP